MAHALQYTNFHLSHVVSLVGEVGELFCLETTTHVYTSHGGKLEGKTAAEEPDPRTL